VEKQDLLRRIIPDPAAVSFFGTYKIEYKDNIKGLPESKQQEYVNNASILNAIREAYQEHASERSKQTRKTLSSFWTRAVLAIKNLPETYSHSLPTHPRRLQEKLREYTKQGYRCFISKKFANGNTVKITEEAGEWMLAQWMSPVNRVTSIEHMLERYNHHAESAGWKKLKSSLAVRNYLYRPEVERVWHAARYGEQKSKTKYQRQNRTILPELRDALWYSDGTKLNYYFQTPEGETKTWQVYEVMDVYSEALLGYHISEREDFEAQYYAYKMAIQTSGHKPYEIKYDNQGGHKKGESSDFLLNLARHAIRTAPYNGNSKTIESAFGRFQSQFLKQDWFFSGQNITTKKDESRANLEFILANTKKLPLLEEVKETYRLRREEWNNAPHPTTGAPRIEMYRASVNEKTVKVGILEMLDMFGVTTKNPSTYTSSGIEIQVKKKIYPYEVLLPGGEPDRDFNRRNVGRRFYTRYQPDDMSMVSLFEKDAKGELRFISLAQSYTYVHRAMQDQTSEDLHLIRQNEHANKEERIQEERQRNALLEKYNLHPNQHGLNVAPLKGISTKKKKMDIGEIQKELSTITEAEELVRMSRKAVRAARKQEEEYRLRQEEEQREFSRRRKQLLELNIN
jgi:hypothetical protein